jgi:hypothetical protein
MKLVYTFTIIFTVVPFLRAQDDSVEPIISDLTNRVMNQIENLQEYISIIAMEEDIKLLGAAKKYALNIFTDDALIEEGSKFKSNKNEFDPLEYLDKINARREKAPRIINFETIDELLPNNLEKIENQDGSVTYRGKMSFKQYYCILKPIEERVEVNNRNENVNCQYSDNTDKEVTVEIRKEMSIKGELWVTKISKIEVIRVYG